MGKKRDEGWKGMEDSEAENERGKERKGKGHFPTFYFTT